LFKRNKGCAGDPIDTREALERVIEIARIVPTFVAGDVNENSPHMAPDDLLQAVGKAVLLNFSAVAFSSEDAVISKTI